MQDRFRFRAWDKKRKKMIYDLESNFMYIYDRFGDYVEDEEDFITMQCTGLKDKNGELIYEGDIVKIGNGSVNGSVIESIREVKWIINTWNIPVWIVDKPNFSHYVEAIGNIYENNELLDDNC